jgi:ammonia channel protein AmtB
VFWTLTGAVLVFYMQIGFSMLEVGSVSVSSTKNVLVSLRRLNVSQYNHFEQFALNLACTSTDKEYPRRSYFGHILGGYRK